MLMLVGLLLGAASVVLLGGSLRRLGDLHFRAVPLVLVALLIQVVINEIVPEGDRGILEAAHIGSYLVIFAFLAVNRRVPGMWIIALGTFLNFVAIAANHGVMPADPGAMRRAGLEQDPNAFENSRPVDDPKLPRLGDWYAVPESWPASNVFSVGDVLIVLGAAVGMHTVGRSRIVPNRFLPAVRNVSPPTP